jgi:CBS-domain-containing membrane protein
MFNLYGVQGRLVQGSLEQLRAVAPLGPVARVRRAASVAVRDADAPAAPTSGPARYALAAYAGVAQRAAREPLRLVREVMSRPARCLSAGASVREAWQLLTQRGIGQAPVVADDGRLVGLAGRAELLPPSRVADSVSDAQAWRELLAQPVSAVMWSPVPAALPETDLRRVAELLLAGGLPGVPVTDGAGQVLGFVSRSDLLRAIVADPPLDLWS